MRGVEAAPLLTEISDRGYAITEPLLAAEEIEALRAALGEIPANERRGGLRDALSRVPAVRRCACDPRILGLAVSVLGVERSRQWSAMFEQVA